MIPTTFDTALAAQFHTDGFAVLSGLYGPAAVAAMLQCLEAAPVSGPNFRRSHDVFAIRNLLGEVPGLWPLLDTAPLRALLAGLFPTGCHLVKAIYFDKPAGSNWWVAWHQDLMINVNQYLAVPGFGPWTQKQGAAAMQPPVAMLENVCTLRIHLDDCDASNGALRVVPGSHRLGVLRPEALAALTPAAMACAVPAGGAMLMRPLLLHASHRSTGERPRRVVHLECATVDFPAPLQWRERMEMTRLSEA